MVQSTKPSLTKTNYRNLWKESGTFLECDVCFWVLLLLVRFSYLFCLLDTLSFWLHLLDFFKLLMCLDFFISWIGKRKVSIKTCSTGSQDFLSNNNLCRKWSGRINSFLCRTPSPKQVEETMEWRGYERRTMMLDEFLHAVRGSCRNFKCHKYYHVWTWQRGIPYVLVVGLNNHLPFENVFLGSHWNHGTSGSQRVTSILIWKDSRITASLPALLCTRVRMGSL